MHQDVFQSHWKNTSAAISLRSPKNASVCISVTLTKYFRSYITHCWKKCIRMYIIQSLWKNTSAAISLSSPKNGSGCISVTLVKYIPSYITHRWKKCIRLYFSHVEKIHPLLCHSEVQKMHLDVFQSLWQNICACMSLRSPKNASVCISVTLTKYLCSYITHRRKKYIRMYFSHIEKIHPLLCHSEVKKLIWMYFSHFDKIHPLLWLRSPKNASVCISVTLTNYFCSYITHWWKKCIMM